MNVTPDHRNWVYKPNEKVKFNLSVTKNEIPVQNVSVRYEVGPEMMAPSKSESLVMKKGTATIDGGTMKLQRQRPSLWPRRPVTGHTLNSGSMPPILH
ncbi:MAG TPA: hypothetical protein DEQ06_00100 [Porphyromonadaceae bacterium]|nr:hypothetical protein [Porphyromonadaceae bacterium]